MGPNRLVGFSVIFFVWAYVLMYVKRLVFVYVCEVFSYLCAFVKIDCVFVFGLMYLCMSKAVSYTHLTLPTTPYV